MTVATVTEEKALTWIGHLFFLSFLLGGIFFYQERLLSFDTAYYTFHVITNEDFFIKHDRFISYLTQWVPIVAMKAGFSLKWVLILFSSSFMAIYYAIFALVAHGFKHPRAGIFIALCYGLCTRFKYYAAISEISISIALAGLLIAWLTRPKVEQQKNKGILHWLIAACLVGLLFISHPIIILPLLFFLGFDLIYNYKWQDWQNWLFLLFLLVVYYIKFQLVATDSYEAGKADAVTFENAVKVFSNPKQYKIFEIINWYFKKEFVVPLIAFGIALLGLLRQRRGELVMYSLFGSAAWFIINILTYSYLLGYVLIMVDGYLAMFGFFWATAMYFTFLQPSKTQFSWLKIGGLVFLILFCLQRIYTYHTFFENRLDQIQATLDRYPDKRKLVVDMDQYDWDIMWYPYEVPHETLMLTAVDGKENSATIYVNDFGKKPEDLKQQDVFYQFDSYKPIKELPSPYFALPDSTTYQLIQRPAWKDSTTENLRWKLKHWKKKK